MELWFCVFVFIFDSHYLKASEWGSEDISDPMSVESNQF